ncbi:mdn1, partial [Symbiodinium sp. KB8]
MLFATQNPPGTYGGRKRLSAAFRNRFIELHVDDLPGDELETILSSRSLLPPSFCSRMVAVSLDLHRRRQKTAVFAGKHGFITARDLLRWAGRRPGDYQELAEEGFMLLGERLRDEEERMELLSVLNTHCKSKLNLEQLYTVSLEIPEDKPAVSSKKGKRALQKAEETKTGDTIAMKEWYNNWNWKLILERLRAWYYSCRGADSGAKSLVMAPPPPVPGTEGLRALAWTQSLQRLFQLLGRAIKNAEP